MFMTEKALAGFQNAYGWKVGVDGSIVVVTVGAGGSIDTDTLTSPIIAFILDQRTDVQFESRGLEDQPHQAMNLSKTSPSCQAYVPLTAALAGVGATRSPHFIDRKGRLGFVTQSPGGGLNPIVLVGLAPAGASMRWHLAFCFLLLLSGCEAQSGVSIRPMESLGA
jgi:hypothetical protein